LHIISRHHSLTRATNNTPSTQEIPNPPSPQKKAIHTHTEKRRGKKDATNPMAFFKITLIRSAIGLPEKKRGVLAALGLHKRMRTVFHPISSDTAGQIMKVKELLAVSTTEEAMSRRQMHEKRRPPPGFVVEKKI